MLVADVLREIGVEADTEATFGEYCPKDFQVEGASEFIDKVNFGLYDQTGVGKTFTIFLSALAWHYLGNKVIIMTKPGLFNQLLQEWDALFIGLDVRPSKELGADILLLSHPSIIIKRFSRAMLYDYEVFIIDEYHKFKNGDGRRFKTLKAITKAREKAVMICTGTPLVKDLRDSFSCVSITNPNRYKDYHAFCRKHVIYQKIERKGGAKSIRIVKGFKNHKQLKSVLEINSRRLLKTDVWKDLEKPIVSRRFLILKDSQKHIYEEFQEFLIFENNEGDLFDASYSPTLKFAKGIQAITNPELFEKGAESCVLDDISRVADEVCIDNKLIVFTLYDKTAVRYAKRLAGFNPALITGSIKESDKFTQDDSCRVLICTLGAGAEGYSFQKVSSYLYLAEYLPVPGWLEQAANRIYRPGQLQAPTLYIPQVKDTIYVSNLLSKAEERHASNTKVVGTDFSLK